MLMLKNKINIVISLLMIILFSSTASISFGVYEEPMILLQPSHSEMNTTHLYGHSGSASHIHPVRQTHHNSRSVSSDGISDDISDGISDDISDDISDGISDADLNRYLLRRLQYGSLPDRSTAPKQQSSLPLRQNPSTTNPITTSLKTKSLIETGIEILKQEMQKKSQSNVVISPSGFYQLLNVIRLGAKGETAQLLSSAIGDFQPSLNLVSSNALLVRQDITVDPSYLDKLKRINGHVINVDFFSHAECIRAARQVNDMCRKITDGMIPVALHYSGLLGIDHLAAVIVNAIYFNKKWQRPFSEHKHEYFYTPKGSTPTVKMMKSTHSVQYITNDKFSAIALPYKQDQGHPATCMLVVLPHTGVSDLSTNELTTGICELKSAGFCDVNINLPAFKFVTEEIDFKPYLRIMGLEELEQFIDIAFSNLEDKLKLYELKQKVRIDVDMDGTRAAAKTSSLQYDTPSDSLPTFTCNRPFFYFIADKWNQSESSILFAGQVADPTQQQ